MKRIAEKVVRVSAIHAVNAALLAVLLIGIPAVTGIDLGSLRLSSDHWLERLTIAGLIVGMTANGLTGFLVRQRRRRAVCWGWTFLYAALLIVAVLSREGYIHFDWLRDFLDSLGRL